jgi:AraC-like DNA-binding protein
MMDSKRPPAAARASRLIGTPAARELVPAQPGHSARWHVHDYPGPYCRWNYHPEFEVHLIQHGTGRFIVGDYISTFTAGQLVLVGSNLPHHWISDTAPGEYIRHRDVVLQFHPAWITDCQRVLPELRFLDPLLRRASRGIEFDHQTAPAAAGALVAIGQAEGLDRLQQLLGLLNLLAKAPQADARLLASPWAPPPGDPSAADLVDRVLSYIADAAGEVKMAEAAAMIGMSESTFSRYFARTAGQSFSDTVRKMRMAQARQLLEHTDRPVATIASRVGYQNLSNFNRQFRRVHQLTPTQFRRRKSSV